MSKDQDWISENKGCYLNTSLDFSFISLKIDFKVTEIFPEDFFSAFNSYVAHMSFLKINLFILFLAVLGLRCCTRAFSSCGEGATLCRGAWASHCGGFSCCRARALGTRASVVVTHGLSCPVACGIFPNQGTNPALAGGFLTTAPLGKPLPLCVYWVSSRFYWLPNSNNYFPMLFEIVVCALRRQQKRNNLQSNFCWFLIYL